MLIQCFDSTNSIRSFHFVVSGFSTCQNLQPSNGWAIRSQKVVRRSKIWVVFGSYFPVNMFLFKSLPQGLLRSEDAISNKLISRCYHAASLGLRDTVKCPPGRRKTKQSKNNGDREQASNSERTEVKWRFSELFKSEVLKSVWKLPKLQAQTSQFKMTVHADERKFGGYVLIKYANLSDTV